MDMIDRIDEKYKELREVFETLPSEQLKVADDLIRQAAFLSVTLEDLTESISANGVVETYTNGEHQSGTKISSEAKLYSSLIAKYTAVVGKLFKMIPQGSSSPKTRTVDSFYKAVAAGILKKTDYSAYMNGQIEL